MIDTATLERVKSIPTKGGIHNVYVTPDGKFRRRRVDRRRKMTVIDARTNEPAWTLFDEGIRPIAFETNADGSTKRLFVQLSESTASPSSISRSGKRSGASMLPEMPRKRSATRGRSTASPSHGIGVTPDGKTLWVASRPNGMRLRVFAARSEAGWQRVRLGGRPDWVTFTPDSKRVYIATENTNSVTVIDVPTIERGDAHQGRTVAEAQHHDGYQVVSAFRRMRWLIGFSACVLASAALIAADDLPDGEGKKILEKSCTTCHDLTEVTKLRGFYSRAQWRDWLSR